MFHRQAGGLQCFSLSPYIATSEVAITQVSQCLHLSMIDSNSEIIPSYGIPRRLGGGGNLDDHSTDGDPETENIPE